MSNVGHLRIRFWARTSNTQRCPFRFTKTGARTSTRGAEDCYALTTKTSQSTSLLVGMVLAASPILSPSVVGIYVSIALYHSYAKLVTDRSWKREDRQEKIGLGVEAAIGDAS